MEPGPGVAAPARPLRPLGGSAYLDLVIDTSDSATTPPQQTDHRRHLDILYRRLDHSTKCNPLVKYGKIFDQKNI